MSIKSTSGRKRQCASSATKTTHDMCPAAETILAAVEHPDIGCPDADVAFHHLLHCRECRAALSFVCTAVAFERDRERQQALWHLFQVKASNVLAHRSGCSDGVCLDAIAAEVPAALILQSSVEDTDAHFWRATLTFSDVDQPEEVLEIRVFNANGILVQDGILTLFGIEIKIINGVGKLTRPQFSECYHKGGAAFRWHDGSVIYGAPVLNT